MEVVRSRSSPATLAGSQAGKAIVAKKAMCFFWKQTCLSPDPVSLLTGLIHPPRKHPQSSFTCLMGRREPGN